MAHSSNVEEVHATSSDKVDFDLDENLMHLGVKGFFPSGLYLILSFFVFLSPMQYMSSHVSSFAPRHHCKLAPSAGVNASSNASASAYSIENIIPKRIVDGVEIFDSCKRFKAVDEFAKTANQSVRETISCDSGWDYPNATKGRSIVDEFDLVCSRGWIPGFMTSIFNVGQAFSGLIVQPLADRFGRKWMLIGTFIGMGASSVMTATLVYDAISYAISKFLLGLFFGGGLLVMFVISIELYPSSHRMWAGMVVEPIWGLGSAAVALAAWLFPQWRHYHLALGIPLFFIIAIIFVFPPDSLPWLMMNGRHEQARKYLEERLRKKGKSLLPLPNSEMERVLNPSTKQESIDAVATTEGTVSSLRMLVNGKVLKQVAIFAFVSTVNSLVYYALTLMATDLSGDQYLSLFLSGIVEVPGYILATISLQFMGRRGPTFMFHLLVGVFMIIVASIRLLGPTPLPQGLNVFSQICYFGAKLSISGSYAIVFLYIPETFPTNVRNTTFGIVDAVARLGGIVAPFSSYLASISHDSVPVFIFSILAFVAGILILFLPEVHGEALPDTLEDLDYLIEGTKMWGLTGKRKDLKRKRGMSMSYVS